LRSHCSGIAASNAWFDNDTRQGTCGTLQIAAITGGNTINITAHGFQNGYQMVLSVDSGGSIYSGLSLTTPYLCGQSRGQHFPDFGYRGRLTARALRRQRQYLHRILNGLSLLSWKTNYYPGWAATATLYVSRSFFMRMGTKSTLTQAQCTANSISITYGGLGAPFGIVEIGLQCVDRLQRTAL